MTRYFVNATYRTRAGRHAAISMPIVAGSAIMAFGIVRRRLERGGATKIDLRCL